MKAKFQTVIILFFISSLLITACGSSQLFGPTLTPVPTFTYTPTVTATITLTPTLTSTNTPTSTTTPTSTSTPTDTSTPIPTQPSGSGMIAFTDNKTGQICLIRADGSHRTCLKVKGSSLAWAPDGKYLLFYALKNGALRIYVMRRDGSNIHGLIDPQYNVKDAAWSPDGAHIAFSAYEPGVVNVGYVMNADGTNITRLSNLFCHSLAWSPDSKQIAMLCYSLKHEDQGIYLIDIDGTHQTKIAGLPETDGAISLTWSPDGQHFAFVVWHNKTTAPFFTEDIYLMNADGSNITLLTDNYRTNSQIAWSPDARHIVFASYISEKKKTIIYIMNADGSNITELTSGNRPVWQP